MALTKADLVARYSALVAGSTLTTRQKELVLAGEGSPEYILQVSSGTSGIPLRIPRSHDDVGDIARRVAFPFVQAYGRPPSRIALIGGISHAEAALKLDLERMKVRSFAAEMLEEIRAFDPDVISTYPSILREILPQVLGESLLCVKLGGERIFMTDLERVFARKPDLLVIEQLGSTEMPAVALRAITSADRLPPYALQTTRFDFRMPASNGWHPLIVEDKYPNLLLPFGDFYDTGDELRWEGDNAYEVRRRNDPANELTDDFETLFRLGCETLQLDLTRRRLLYTGALHLPSHVVIGGREFESVVARPERILPSNKAPLVFSPAAKNE